MAESNKLILIDGETKDVIRTEDIKGWNISKMNAYLLQVFLTNGQSVDLPLHGFFSEAKVVAILSSLNLPRIERPKPIAKYEDEEAVPRE